MMMRVLIGLFSMAFSVAVQAQVTPSPATPKKDPFAGFGNALDKRPHSYNLARTPVPASATPPGPATVSLLPTASNGLSFEARLISSGGASKVEQGGLQSSETRQSKMLVELRAHNFSATPAETRLEWFFVARDLQSKKYYVWSRGDRQLSLAGGAEQTEMAESTELARTTTKTTEIGIVTNAFGQTIGNTFHSSKSETGARPYGWIVRMWANGHLVQVRTSSNHLEAMGRLSDPK